MKSLLVSLTIGALATALTIRVVAKGTSGVGIYGVIDKVAFEPNATSPDRIRVSGLFVVPLRMSSGEYSPPQRGFLYFKIVPGHEQAARKDWAALTSVAGTGEAVGFTFYWVPNPLDPNGNPHRSLEVTVHNDGDAASPDDYPLAFDEVHRPAISGLVKPDNPAFDPIVMKQLDGNGN
jgi:hypothetical protein